MTATLLKPLALLSLIVGAAAFELFVPGQAAPPAAADKAAPDKAATTDLLGDPLPPYARARLGTIRFRQGDGILSVRYLPDGTLVSVGSEQSLRFWDPANGRERHHFTLPSPFATALSPDHKLAVSNEGSKMQVWDVATGKALRDIKWGDPNGMNVNQLHFAPDGKTFGAVVQSNNDGKNHVQLWDATTGKEVHKLEGPPPKEEGQPGFQAFAFSFSPDGKHLAAAGTHANRGTICIWEVASGKRMPELAGHAERANPNPQGRDKDEIGFIGGAQARFVFTPDGKTLADVVIVPGKNKDKDDDDGQLVQKIGLWDVATGKHQRDIGELKGGVGRLLFAPTGKTLATFGGGNNQAVHLFDMVNGKELPEFKTEAFINAVAFAPDGKVVAIGVADQTIRLWDAAAGKELHLLKGYTNRLESNLVNGVIDDGFLVGGQLLAFAPNGKTLAGSGGTLIRQWTVADGKEVQPVKEAHEGTVLALALSPDGKHIATVSSDNTARLWDAATAKEVRVFQGSTSREPTPLPRFPGDFLSGQSAAVAFAPDGKALAIGWPAGDAIQLLDVNTGKEIRALKGHTTTVTSLAFTPDGKTLLSAGQDGRVVWWNLANGKSIRQFAGAPLGEDANPDPDVNPFVGGPVSVALSPDGKTLAETSSNGLSMRLRLWELTSGKMRREFTIVREGAGNPFDLKFGPDGAVRGGPFGPDGLIPTGRPLFAPDGKSLAWAIGDNILLYDAVRGKEIRRFGVADCGIQGTAFSPDGRHLLAAAQDGKVHVWETATGTVVGQLTGHRGQVTAVAFLGDGQTLASSASDTTVLLWDLPRFLAAQKPVPPAPLNAGQLAPLWDALAKDDAPAATEAQDKLVEGAKQSVPWLRERLKPVPPVDDKRLAQLVADLESDTFATRKKATDELARLGDAAEAVLQKRLAEKPPLEGQMRIEELLAKLTGPVTDPELLRSLRAVEVLEQAGTAEAQEFLQQLAQGAPQARLTREAKAALDRLAKMKK